MIQLRRDAHVERGRRVNLWALPGNRLRTKTLLMASAGAVLLIVGASMPWVSAHEQFYLEADRLARESGVHGVYAIAGAVLVLVLTGYFLISEQWQYIKLLSILILVVALGAIYIAVTDLVYIQSDLLGDLKLDSDDIRSASISLAPGLYITLVACGVLAAGGAYSTFRSFLPDPASREA